MTAPIFIFSSAEFRTGRETAEAPPVADEARLFRGSGTIGGHEVHGNRYAATVVKPQEEQWL